MVGRKVGKDRVVIEVMMVVSLSGMLFVAGMKSQINPAVFVPCR